MAFIRKLTLFLFQYVTLFCILLMLLLNSCKHHEPQNTEILWDVWGVPHIYGKNSEDILYAFGWAQMHNHGDLILRLYGQSRGRGAEYWDESYLGSDRYIHIMDVPERSLTWYESQPIKFQKYLNAFVKGMNDYAKAHGDQIDDKVKIVLPIEVTDVLAHTQRAIHLTWVARNVREKAQNWQSVGSNAWAISPSRSASGNTLLLSNPHLPWSDLFMLFEAQLSSPDVNAYGVTFVGFPALAFAFNDFLGWSHTNNTFDGMDLYELKLAEEGYIFDGDVHAFRTKKKTLKIKQEDGTLHEEQLIVKHSIHGPVLEEKDGNAVAVRLAGLDQPHILTQWWEMMHATNLNEFEMALKHLQIPVGNVIYADKDGHIMYLFGGRLPKREIGDWDFWQGTIPGNISDTLWTTTHPYNDLPRVLDPMNGWVQNANDPPWTSTYPIILDFNDFPSYMSPRQMSFRAQRSVQMINSDENITFEELIQYKLSTRMEVADRILDDLISAAQHSESNLVRQAVGVLKSWDRNTDSGSRGAVLFTEWFHELSPLKFDSPWSEKNPLTTPDGLADSKSSVSALESAAKKVIKTYGSLDVPWGDVYRLRYAGIDIPANGGPGELGIFRVLKIAPDKDGRFRSVGGDSYVAVVEFSNPIRAQVLLSYGNATQPASTHVGDQLELFSRKKLRPVWRTRKEIEAHLESKDTF